MGTHGVGSEVVGCALKPKPKLPLNPKPGTQNSKSQALDAWEPLKPHPGTPPLPRHWLAVRAYSPTWRPVSCLGFRVQGLGFSVQGLG